MRFHNLKSKIMSGSSFTIKTALSAAAEGVVFSFNIEKINN